MTAALIAEELSWGCAGLAATIGATMFPVRPLLALRHRRAAERYLPRLASEEGCLAAIAFTEPQRRLRRRRDRGRPRAATATSYVLNGEKCYVTNGGIAELTHRLREARRRDHRVPRRARRPRRLRRAARRTSSACARRTPARSSSTTRGSPPTGCSARRARASSIAMDFFERSRPQVAAGAVGVARAAFEYATELRPRAQGVREAAAREAGRLVQARRHGDADRGGAAARSGARARRSTRGEDAGLLGSYAKAFAADTAMQRHDGRRPDPRRRRDHARPPGREMDARREGASRSSRAPRRSSGRSSRRTCAAGSARAPGPLAATARLARLTIAPTLPIDGATPASASRQRAPIAPTRLSRARSRAAVVARRPRRSLLGVAFAGSPCGARRRRARSPASTSAG